MTPKLKKIIIGIIIAIILFVAYAILKPDPAAEVLIGNRDGAVGTISDQQSRILGAQITQALLKIDQIKLDRSVFDNVIFKSLSDRSQNIAPEPWGRSNPFAPLGDTSVNSAVRDTPEITNASSTEASVKNASTTKPITKTPPTAGVVVETN